MTFIQNNQTTAARVHRESYMSVHVLLNLLNEFGKEIKYYFVSFFRNEFNKIKQEHAFLSICLNFYG